MNTNGHFRINGDLAACNQKKSDMKTKGNAWHFKEIDGLDIAVLEDGYSAKNFKNSIVSRPCGVKGSNLRMVNEPILSKKRPKTDYGFRWRYHEE